MKHVFLVLLVFALCIPALAREIEISHADAGGLSILSHFSPVFAGKGETELLWDDGTSVSSYFQNGYVPYATTFTAPADCHLVRYRYYWYNGGNVDVDGLLFADDGSNTPTGSTLFTVTGNSGTTSYDWFEVDVSGEGVTYNNGDIFHPGWTWAAAGSWGVMLDSAVSGSYACWLTLSSNWYDYSGNYVHMMRVVVNDDMDGPYASDQDPANGAVSVPVDADILFDIQDDDVGVDSGTINANSVIVEEDGSPISGTISVDDGDPNDVHVTFDPDSDFGEGVSISVTVSPSGNEIMDDLGNVMAEDSWSFETWYDGIESTSLGTIKAEFK